MIYMKHAPQTQNPQNIFIYFFQLNLDPGCAIGIGVGVGIGIESLRLTMIFHFAAETKGPADILDKRRINTKFLMSAIHIAPFNADFSAFLTCTTLR